MTPADNFTGWGIRPLFTFLQTLVEEHANSTSTTGCRTRAIEGRESKSFSESRRELVEVLDIWRHRMGFGETNVCARPFCRDMKKAEIFLLR